MNSVAFAGILALSLLTQVIPRATTAQNSGPSANGKFQFTLADGRTRYVEFDAKTQPGGGTRGQMTFNDPQGVPATDVDGASGGAVTAGSPISVYVKAELDCLVVSGNRAVVGGAVTEATLPAYIGQRVLLVVEDNGEGINAPAPDKLTWGVYHSPARNWTPKDAERPDDNGALLTWSATDAERPDDVGISSRPSEVVGCQSFPLSSYSFVDVQHGAGNIQVRP